MARKFRWDVQKKIDNHRDDLVEEVNNAENIADAAEGIAEIVMEDMGSCCVASCGAISRIVGFLTPIAQVVLRAVSVIYPPAAPAADLLEVAGDAVEAITGAASKGLSRDIRDEYDDYPLVSWGGDLLEDGIHYFTYRLIGPIMAIHLIHIIGSDPATLAVREAEDLIIRYTDDVITATENVVVYGVSSISSLRNSNEVNHLKGLIYDLVMNLLEFGFGVIIYGVSMAENPSDPVGFYDFVMDRWYDELDVGLSVESSSAIVQPMT